MAPPQAKEDPRQPGAHEKPPPTPEQQQVAKTTAVLQRDIKPEDRQKYNDAVVPKNGQKGQSDGTAFGEKSKSLDIDHTGGLWGRYTDQRALNTDRTKLTDRLSHSDRQPDLRKVDSNYEPADKDLRAAIHERYRGDQPTINRLEQRLDALKSKVLNKQVGIEGADGKVRPDGPKLDQGNTYREFCESLAHIARNGENTRTEKGELVYDRGHVNEAIEDALIRGEDPFNFEKSFQVGPTCGIEGLNKVAQGMAVGNPAFRVAEAMKTGRMTLVDPITHEKFTTHVDLASFHPTVRGQGAYRQAMEVTTAQALLAFDARNSAREQGLDPNKYNDYYTYKHVNPVDQADSGIRIAVNPGVGKLFTPSNTDEIIARDRNTGDLVLFGKHIEQIDRRTQRVFYTPVDYPETSQFSLGRTVQGLIGESGGQYVGKDVGDKLTFLSGKMFGNHNIQFGTKTYGGKQMTDQLASNKAVGWENALYVHNAFNYPDWSKNAGKGKKNPGDGGGHVATMSSGTKEGTVNVDGQWLSGRDTFNDLSAETAVAWMEDPVGLPMINRPGGGGLYYPIGPGSHNVNEGTNLVDRDKNKTPGSELEDKDRKEREAIAAQAQKEREREEQQTGKQKQWLLAQAEQARAQLAALDHELAGANGDPEKTSRLQSQKQFLLHQGQTLST